MRPFSLAESPFFSSDNSPNYLLFLARELPSRALHSDRHASRRERNVFLAHVYEITMIAARSVASDLLLRLMRI